MAVGKDDAQCSCAEGKRSGKKEAKNEAEAVSGEVGSVCGKD